jgi:PAS domain S-box-containing protein
MKIRLAFEGTDLWQEELAQFLSLAILGAAASYLSVNIPHTEVFIEGRWTFGFVGFALLHHWWTALLLACVLSLTRIYELSPLTILVGNMLYAFPAFLVIRTAHKRLLDRLRSPVWYGLAWLLMILLCYQLFNTPAPWGFLAFLRDDPIWPAMLEGWREQPFLVESFLVGIISALIMTVVRSNQALRASQRELETTLYSIGDGVIATDVDGQIRRMNPVAEALTGWREADAVGQPLRTVFNTLNEDTREPVENPVTQVLQEGLVVGLANHTLLVARDGTERPIADSAAPIRGTNNLTSGVVMVFRDQSEERAAQRALEASHDRLTLALRNARMGIWDWDVKTDQVNWYGEHSSLFGLPRESFGGTIGDVQQGIHPDDREQSMRVFRRTVETGADFDDTYRVVWPDGSVRWMHSYGKLACDEGGAPCRVVGTTQDITARRRAEEERVRLTTQVHEQARQMEQILTAVPAGVLLLDAEGRILRANLVAESDLAVLTDVKAGQVLTHLGDRPLAELLTSPPTKGLWHEVKTDDRIFEVIARPVEPEPDDQQPPPEGLPEGEDEGQWVLVINDVTREREIKAQLQQQERLAVVGQLAAGIAHDFNNIMGAIILYAQMTGRSAALPAQDRERMMVINQQARHATDLIEQILDFSRRSVLERRALDLLPLLKEHVKLLRRTLPEHIGVELDYGHDEYVVHADPTRMQQMVTNLAVNARDAMPDGGTLRIALERVAIEEEQLPPLVDMEAGAWVRLTISDTGTGIAPDALPHIFEPFFTTKEPGEGSGLGLAQVHGIVGAHEGHIDVESRVGGGTTMTIYLPALMVHSPPSPLPGDSAEPMGRGEVVLVVEDRASMRAALTASLEQLNYRTLEAVNGEQALTIIEEQGDEVALVLSDVVMPVMSGIALFHELQQMEAEIPIILLTGHPMDKELEALHEQGLTAWLTKPPSIEQLAQVIDDVLRRA